MTREQLLRYAQKTGGMFGRQLAIANNANYTLDRVYWTGNTYTFIYNVDALTFSFKKSIKLPDAKALCNTAMALAKEVDTAVEAPAAFNMITKLHTLTSAVSM